MLVQKDFGSKKNVGPKKCGYKKDLDSNKIWVKKSLSPKNFRSQNILGPNWFLVQKNILGPKNFGSKKILVQRILGPKNFGLKKILVARDICNFLLYFFIRLLARPKGAYWSRRTKISRQLSIIWNSIPFMSWKGMLNNCLHHFSNI